MALTDLLNAFSPGAGAGGGLTAAPGQGLTTEPNAPRSLTASSAIMQVPGFEGTNIHDVLGGQGFPDIGGQQQGGLGERLGGMGSAGVADPTLGNIARALALGASIASPLSPFGLAEGAILSQAGLPGYASPIMGALASAFGLPGPIDLKSFTGWGAIPQQLQDAVSRGLITPAQYQAAVQQLQEAHQGLGGFDSQHISSAIQSGLGAGSGSLAAGAIAAALAADNSGGGGGAAAAGGGGQSGFGGQAGRAGF